MKIEPFGDFKSEKVTFWNLNLALKSLDSNDSIHVSSFEKITQIQPVSAIESIVYSDSSLT